MQNPSPKVISKDAALTGRRSPKKPKDSVSFLVTVSGTESHDGTIIAANGLRWKV